ncbi:MAG TPA: hypothetical protein VFU05_01820 [Cyclobacteriaceae bacterium]|nr:hypothetical protein [Cyclobacteriaceae bacterium]
MSFFKFLRSQATMVSVSLTLLVQLLNLSIDPTDFGKEDLSKNEVESIVELVTEHFLDHKNLIDESDDGDQQSIHCEMQIMLFPGTQPLVLDNTLVASAKPLPAEFQFYVELVPKTILTPPPQA